MSRRGGERRGEPGGDSQGVLSLEPTAIETQRRWPRLSDGLALGVFPPQLEKGTAPRRKLRVHCTNGRRPPNLRNLQGSEGVQSDAERVLCARRNGHEYWMGVLAVPKRQPESGWDAAPMQCCDSSHVAPAVNSNEVITNHPPRTADAGASTDVGGVPRLATRRPSWQCRDKDRQGTPPPPSLPASAVDNVRRPPSRIPIKI